MCTEFLNNYVMEELPFYSFESGIGIDSGVCQVNYTTSDQEQSIQIRRGSRYAH